MRATKNIHLGLVMALMLVACTTQDKLIVTGESMVALADTFVATAGLMDTAYENKVITGEQYKEWTAFGNKFKRVYLLAVAMWRAAKDMHDPVLENQMILTVNGLAIELADFGTKVK